MKNNLYFALVLMTLNGLFPSILFSQIPFVPDSLSVEWEQLDGPQGAVFDYVEIDNKLFAGTSGGLFTSTDGGKIWKSNNTIGNKSLMRLVKVQDALLVLLKNDSLLNDFTIYRSVDKGVSWTKTFDSKEYSYSLYSFTAQILVTNDSIVSLFPSKGIFKCTIAWHSFDFGQTWIKTWDNDRTMSCVSATEDTIVGVFEIDSNNPQFANFGKIDVLGQAPMINLSGLPDIGSYTTFCAYKNGTFSIIYQPRTIYQTTDKGATWTNSTLPVEGVIKELYYWDGFYYLRSTMGIWKGTFDAPFSFTKIYNAEGGGSQESKAMSITDAGLWVNTNLGNSMFSSDNGVSWEERSKGIIGRVGTMRSFCGKLVTSSGNNSTRSEYLSNQQDGVWQKSNSLGYARILGELNGVAYAYPPVLRSIDCGAKWDTILYPEIHIEGAPEDLVTSGNRVFFWNIAAAPILYSDNNGSNWFPIPIPTQVTVCKNFFAIGDSLYYFTGTLNEKFLYRSFNFGQTWGKITVDPSYDNIYKKADGRIFAVIQPDRGVGGIAEIIVSNDHGDTWTKTSTIGHFYPELLYQYTPGIWFPYISESLIVLHADNGVFVSQNDGINWTRLVDLPFFNASRSSNLPSKVEGAISYHVDEGYFYAGTESQGIWRTPFAPIRDHLKVQSKEYGFLDGRLFKDADGDCLYSSGTNDKPLSYKPVRINPGNILTATDANGWYSVALPIGNYTISAQAPTYFNSSCVTDSVTAAINLGQTVTANLPFAPIPDIRDLCLLITNPTPSRPGFETTVKMQVANVGTALISGAVINFVFDNQWLLPISIAPIGQFVGNGASIALPDLAAGESMVITFTFQVLAITPLGTPLVFIAECPLSEDANSTNNLARATQTVQGSYDPNDKNALPLITLPPGQPRVLDYLIRFQNTGTDTAFTVVVTDTLQAGLNLLSLRTVEASHEFQFSFLPGRVCKWRFRNILLPDSNINEAASHGYLRFQIETDPGLLPGTPIRNDADIFFDFNSPIRTNEAASENPKWVVTEVTSVVLCAGDTWNGQTFNTSETLIDTMGNVWSDTISVVNLNVLPTYETHIDTTLSMGALLFNIPMLQDTAFSFALLSTEGCDSTVVWHVTVTTSGLGEIAGNNLQFELRPNPATQETWLVWNTRQTAEFQAGIKLFNTSGMLLRSWESRVLSAAAPISLNVADLPPGVYFVMIQSKNFNGIKRLAKL